jgi:hypothetical protein
MSNPLTIANALCLRVGRHGIANGLNHFCKNNSLEHNLFTPIAPLKKHLVSIKTMGLECLMHHPHEGRVDVCDAQRWCMTDLRFYINNPAKGHYSDSLPFGLNPYDETPETIVNKLSNDFTHITPQQYEDGQYEQSYFLDDALVIQVTWTVQHQHLKGLSRVWVVRLGTDSKFEPPT